MEINMKKILVPGIIFGFFLMLINASMAFAQQQTTPAEKTTVKKMETQMQTMPATQPEVTKNVTESQKMATTKMENTGKEAMMSNHEIKAVQEALNKDGYKLKVDGIMGMQTSNALKGFQTKNDLKVTGQPDPMTLAKLNLK